MSVVIVVKFITVARATIIIFKLTAGLIALVMF